MVSIGYGTFIRDGYLGEGQFKFLNVLGDYNSSLVADEEDKRVYDGQTYRLIGRFSRARMGGSGAGHPRVRR